MKEIKKIRYDYIDILKVIAIIMVIILNLLKLNFDIVTQENVKTYIMFFIRMLCEGVPIFICINGFLIINKNFDIKKHLLKTLKVFIILIIWSFIDVVIIKLINGESLNINNIIKNVLLTNISNTYTGPLWFLQNLIMLYLIFPVLKVVHDENKKIYNYLFLIVSIFTVGLNLLENFTIILQDLTNLEIKLLYTFMNKYNPIANGSFIFYFMLGGYIFESKEKLQDTRNRIFLICIGVLSTFFTFSIGIIVSKLSNKTVLGGFNYCTIAMAFIIIAMFAMFYTYKNKNHIYNKFLADLGKNSLGIYLVHKIVAVVACKYLTILQGSCVKILIPIIILISSYAIVKIIQKIPKVKQIVEI